MHQRTSSKGLLPISTTNLPPSMYSPYSPNPHSPQSSSVSLLGPQAVTRRDGPGFQATHMQAPQPGAAGAMPLGNSYSNSEMESFSSKYSLAPDPARWGARVDYGHPEADDDLHNPDPKRDCGHDSGGTFCTARGVANLGCLAILLVGLIGLFAGYPMLAHFLDKPMSNLGGYNLGGINATGQVPELPGNYGLIDRDTPPEAYTHTSFEDGSEWDLVFSDEFNTDGRSFYPGDDPYWEAVDIHYWGTNNLEWYAPDMVTTSGGYLNLTLNKIPWRGLEYKGGLITSWNKFCFTGGYLVANVSLPGRSDVYGLWPAVWTMGNLGRAGYGASVDGMWPCTLPNQTRPDGTPLNATINGDPGKEGVLSYLPGQRLSACTCAGESHPGPKRPDGTFVGRSAPEIDIIEAQVDSGSRIGHVSMSGQWAPYNYGYEWFNTSDNFITHQPGLKLNTYHGGAYQQTTSVLVDTNQRCYVESGGCFSVYGFEYKRGNDGYITWIGPRPVPMEPMYMIVNLGISPNFGAIDFDNLVWPTTMLVDWIRVYQPKDAHNIGCDPPDYPTADYINT
ncbi:hypothetical protein RSAG8_07640, partial [Rhizoctonia solani AG-8 WAC10335]